MKNKLLIVFIVLLTIYAGITFFGDKNERSFDDNIFKFNTENVDKIKITPKDQSKKEFVLLKSGDEWLIQQDSKEYKADNGFVENTLSSLENIKIKSIVTKNPDKLAKYELEDGKSKRVELFSGKNKTGDFLIGKFKFNQQMRTMSSYIRKTGENTVYSTDNFSGISISDNINSYRIKTLAKFVTDDLKSIEYSKQGQTKTIEKALGGEWITGDMTLDSLKMKSYISTLSNMNGSEMINNDYSAQNTTQSSTISLNFDNKAIEIIAYHDTINSNGFVIHSSINEDTYFKSDSNGLYKRIFSKLDEIIK